MIIVEYKKKIIRRIKKSPERWLIVFGGEFFHFHSLPEAIDWVDFRSKAYLVPAKSKMFC